MDRVNEKVDGTVRKRKETKGQEVPTGDRARGRFTTARNNAVHDR